MAGYQDELNIDYDSDEAQSGYADAYQERELNNALDPYHETSVDPRFASSYKPKSRDEKTAAIIERYNSGDRDPALVEAYYKLMQEQESGKSLELGTTAAAADEIERARALEHGGFSNYDDLEGSRASQEAYVDLLERIANGEGMMGGYFDKLANDSRANLTSMGASARGGYDAATTRTSQTAASDVGQALMGQRDLGIEMERQAAQSDLANALQAMVGQDYKLGAGTRALDSAWDQFREKQGLGWYERGANERAQRLEALLQQEGIDKGQLLEKYGDEIENYMQRRKARSEALNTGLSFGSSALAMALAFL